MRRIRTIRLQNFQSHKDTVIDADTDVLVLSGESNQGKSAVLKGLNWLMTNRPNGIGFISKWVKERNRKGEIVLTRTAVCSVSITLEGDDGREHTITRMRTRDKNVYEVDGLELEAMGTTVPDEVSKLLGMHECNVQSQDDTYFMLALPPGQVAAKLNELVHLDTIDRAYDYSRKGKSRCSTLLKEWDGIVGKTKFEMDGLKHIPDLVEQGKELQELLGKYNELQESVAKMHFLAEDYRNLLEKLGNDGPDLDSTLDRLSDLLADYEYLCSQKGNAEECLALHDDLASRLEEYPDVAAEDMDGLSRMIAEHSECMTLLSGIAQMKVRYISTEKELSRVDSELEEAAKELPATCPTCGRPLNREEL